MDTILSSSVQSPLLSTLTGLKTSNLGPSINRNFPNISKKLIKINPVSQAATAGFSSELLFNIPDNFHIDGMMLECNVNIGGTQTANDSNHLGERFFSTVALKSHGATIFQQTDGSCALEGRYGSPERSLTHSYLTNVNVSATDGADVIFYTPIYNEVFNKVESSLDATFLEKLTVSATINTKLRTGLVATGTGMDETSIYLWISGWSLSSEEQEKLEASVFKSNEPIGLLTSNVYQEIHTIANGSTSTTLDLKCKNVVSEIGFFMRVAATGIVKPITNYTLDTAGATMYSAIPAKVSQWQRSKMGKCGGEISVPGLPAVGAVISDSELKPITIQFGMEGDGTYNSGACAFSGLSNPQLTVTYADPGAASELVVVYKSHQLVMVQPSSGAISIGQSS